MAEDNQTTTTDDQAGISIPDEVLKKFPELTELIKASQSMNDEERQYWVDVLPIMSEDQITNLQSILDNEKRQIEEVEQGYQEDMQKEVSYFNLEFDELKYKEKKRIRLEAEKQHELDEQRHEEELLAELANL